MKHATIFITLLHHVRHAPFLLALVVASSAVANDGTKQLKDLGIGAVNANHFAGSHCRFWTKESNGDPGPEVIIETDFSKAWLNINGRDMSFRVLKVNDYVTILRTIAGKIELTETTDPVEASDDLTLGTYRMYIRLKPKTLNKSVKLLARCE
jgi:hypothetical protein